LRSISPRSRRTAFGSRKPSVVTSVDLRARRPARQKLLQDTRGGRLADSDRAGDADDERRLDRLIDIEEMLALLEQALRRLDMGISRRDIDR
jgi:hypothetical protein